MRMESMTRPLGAAGGGPPDGVPQPRSKKPSLSREMKDRAPASFGASGSADGGNVGVIRINSSWNKPKKKVAGDGQDIRISTWICNLKYMNPCIDARLMEIPGTVPGLYSNGVSQGPNNRPRFQSPHAKCD
jgi:hypothetical protein